MNTQRTEFEGGDGIVISLDTIIAGGKTGVIQDMKDELWSTEEVLQRLDDDRCELMERVDHIELLIARGNAKRDALKIAIAAAENALCP